MSLFSEKDDKIELSEELKEFFRTVGAHGVDGVDEAAVAQMNRDMEAEYALLIEHALSSEQVANILGVSTSQVRQRFLNHTLHSIERGNERLFPLWQFLDERQVHGLDEILPLLNQSLYPLAVKDFFLRPNPELKDEHGGALSPLVWLELGYEIKTIKHIVRFL